MRRGAAAAFHSERAGPGRRDEAYELMAVACKQPSNGGEKNEEGRADGCLLVSQTWGGGGRERDRLRKARGRQGAERGRGKKGEEEGTAALIKERRLAGGDCLDREGVLLEPGGGGGVEAGNVEGVLLGKLGRAAALEHKSGASQSVGPLVTFQGSPLCTTTKSSS